MNLESTETAREIVERSGSNLAFALAILPREKRRDMEVFYAFCRVIDDIADDPDIPIEERKSRLNRWRKLIAGDKEARPGIETEFVSLVGKYRLSNDLLNEIINGVAMDLEPCRCETFEDLKQYCFRVASAVGLVSIEIFGYQNDDTRIYAENLGYALQWTNILRDVGEDAAESRIYLPLEDLDQFGIEESELLSGHVSSKNKEFRRLMEKHVAIARQFYSKATDHLAMEDRHAMRSPELMRHIYFGILEKMENDGFRVFEKRYRLSKMRMLGEFLRAKLC